MKNIFKKRKRSKIFANIRQGFTLIELTVGIFIITLLTGLLLANYHSTNKRQEVINSAQKLASGIRLAQQFSLGAKEFKGNIPAGGWGVHCSHFSLQNLCLIFADADGNKNYDTLGGEDYQTIVLPDDIYIYPSDCTGIFDQATVFFIPPDPETYMTVNFFNPKNQVCITLTDQGFENKKIVEVNSLGLVDIRDY